jgi:hypothetical protein
VNPSDDTPEDRKWRHYIEGRVLDAVATATSEIQRDVGLVKRALFGDELDSGDKGLVGDVRTIKGWLVGDTTADGQPTGGIATKVRDLWAVRMWVVGLVATGVAVAIGALTLQILQAFHVVPTGKP